MTETVIDWRPIDSAPRNDTIILTDGGSLWQGFWAHGFDWITGYDDGTMHVRVLLRPTHRAPT